MKPKEFQVLLSQTMLTAIEKGMAWNHYKTESPETANSFVQNMENKFASMRKNLQLKSSGVPYRIWGEKYIESETIVQMNGAARLPVAIAGALMPDAHLVHCKY